MTAFASGAARAHVSLNVTDLERSVAFYRRFLDVEPTTLASDYAKFETSSLVLSLEPVFHRASDAFNHLGLRLATPGEVHAVSSRLVAAGLHTNCEDGVECCYSTQTKLWLADPDQNLWEVYALTGELAHRGELSTSAALANKHAPPAQTAYEHRLGTPAPTTIPGHDLDEVRLRGTFNGPIDDPAALLSSSARALKPGGRLIVHGLVADAELDGGPPQLPGPAAPVRVVPMAATIVRLVEQAGFCGVYLQKLSPRAPLSHKSVALRELLLMAWTADVSGPAATVVYRGPFLEVVVDGGDRFRRGTPTLVDGVTAARLRCGPTADAFVFFDAAVVQIGSGNRVRSP